MNLDTFFGYVDNPNTSKSSIMKYSRNRNGMTAPKHLMLTMLMRNMINNFNIKYGG